MNWRGIVQLGEPNMRVRVMKEFATKSGALVKVIPFRRNGSGHCYYKVVARSAAEGDDAPVAEVADDDRLEVAGGDYVDLEVHNVNYHLSAVGSVDVALRGEGIFTDDGPGKCRVIHQSVSVIAMFRHGVATNRPREESAVKRKPVAPKRRVFQRIH